MNSVVRLSHEVTGCVFELRKANRVISDKIECIENKDPKSIYRDDARLHLSNEILIQYLEQELTRREAVEEKAKTNVLGITLAFSAIFAGVALISSNSIRIEFNIGWLHWMTLSSLLVGGIFLLLGGTLALSALRIAKIYAWTLEDEVIEATAEARAAKVIWYVELNQETTRLKTNQIAASYSCIRNGVAALAITALFIALSSFQPWNASTSCL